MLRDQVRLALVAVGYMTRLPLPAWVGHGAWGLDRAARYFPLAGLLVGAVGALVLAGARVGLPPLAAAGLALAAMVALTGALHEDGLADTLDGLGGGWTRDDALRIMKDSRIGAYGAAGLVLLLGIKAAVLAELPVSALLASGPASRLMPVCIMALLPYARVGDAAARAAPVATGPGGLAVAALFGLAPLTLLGWRALPALLAATLLTGLMAAWFRRRLGGWTGDTLGAVQQATELAILLAAAWHAA